MVKPDQFLNESENLWCILKLKTRPLQVLEKTQIVINKKKVSFEEDLIFKWNEMVIALLKKGKILILGEEGIFYGCIISESETGRISIESCW